MRRNAGNLKELEDFLDSKERNENLRLIAARNRILPTAE